MIQQKTRLGEANALLDRIDEFLPVGDNAAAHVAAILSALRGPDSGPELSVKSSTTVPIRISTFPKLAASSSFIGLGWQMEHNKPFKLEHYDDHFHTHIYSDHMALLSLGRWNRKLEASDDKP